MKAIHRMTGEVIDSVEGYTQWIRPLPDQGEKMDSKPAVTIEPYMPPQIQVADMMDAGLRLAEARKARYDTVELGIGEGEDVPLDPTRAPGVDMVDIQRAAEKASAALKASYQSASEAAAAKAKAEAEAADQARIQAAAEALLAKREAEKAGA